MNRDHISLKLPLEERESGEDEFTMYVMDISYFSGKLECYFNYQVTLLLLLQIVYSSSQSPHQKQPLAGSQVAEGGT